MRFRRMHRSLYQFMAAATLAVPAMANANVVGAQGNLMMQSVPALTEFDATTMGGDDRSLLLNTISDSSFDSLIRDSDLSWLLQPSLNILDASVRHDGAKQLDVFIVDKDFDESKVRQMSHPGVRQLLNVMQSAIPIEANKIYQVKGVDDLEYTFVFLSSEKIKKDWQVNGDEISAEHLSMFLGTKLGSCLSKLDPKYLRTYKLLLRGLTITDDPSLSWSDAQKEKFVAGLMHGSTKNKFGEKITPKNLMLPFSEEVVLAGKVLGTSHLITRSLVNLPANHLNPATYHRFVIDLVDKVNAYFELKGSFQLKVYSSDELKELNGNLLNGVGQGSRNRARIFQLMWRPDETEEFSLLKNEQTGEVLKVAIVGKGITHDSGGINVKTSGAEHMHRDMGGSAVALSTAVNAAIHGVNKNVDVWLAVAENSISKDAYRPGDILTSVENKAVYIGNTDAEGRLAMSTAIELAGQLNSDIIFDLATLTGANAIATGSQVEGLFTNMGKQVARKIEDLGHQIGEMVAIQPLLNIYGKSLKHARADFNNIGNSRYGSHITAALFLRLFLRKNENDMETPWAHFDISVHTDAPCALSAEPGACGRMSGLMSEIIKKVKLIDGKAQLED